MFQSLTERLSGVIRSLSGKSHLTKENIQEALTEIKKALLQADVALEVIKSFLQSIETQAVGQAISSKLTPDQFLVKIVNEQLVHLMGDKHTDLSLSCEPPAVILMAGLQGSGKTTTTGKLAKFLKESKQKRVMLVSTDIYRPAALEQLETLANTVGVACFPVTTQDTPQNIVKNALETAKKQLIDVLLVDTAGRLHIDESMMEEIRTLHKILNPVETLFVVDSMTGQDAANTAKAFHDALPLTGVILTKADGDARGGAALSVRHLTGKPIKFMGVGEKLEALEAFHPERIASRILGMGDVLSLVEEIERKTDEKDKQKAQKLAQKIKKGRGFDLADLRDQLKQMGKMGGMAAIIGKLPGLSQIPEAMKANMDDSKFTGMIAVIDSMTFKERRYPHLIKGSRKKRIANGSGKTIADVNKVLSQHQKMERMMKKMSSRGGMQNLMQGLQGKLPPGFM